MARRFTSRPAVAPRRKRVWTRSTDLAATLGPMTTSAPLHHDLMSTWAVAGGPNIIGATIARVRLQAMASGAPTASALGTLNWGVHVGPSTLDTIDHDPSLDAHLDWMAWGAIAVYDTTSPRYPQVLEYDVKSMRKLDELGDTLWLCQGTGMAASNYTVRWTASVLVLLP